MICSKPSVEWDLNLGPLVNIHVVWLAFHRQLSTCSVIKPKCGVMDSNVNKVSAFRKTLCFVFLHFCLRRSCQQPCSRNWPRITLLFQSLSSHSSSFSATIWIHWQFHRQSCCWLGGCLGASQVAEMTCQLRFCASFLKPGLLGGC